MWRRALPPPPALLAEVRPRRLDLPFGIVGPELVTRLRAMGLLVGGWMVGRPSNTARLPRSGVDAVTTDRIGVLRRMMSRQASAQV